MKKLLPSRCLTLTAILTLILTPILTDTALSTEKFFKTFISCYIWYFLLITCIACLQSIVVCICMIAKIKPESTRIYRWLDTIVFEGTNYVLGKKLRN